MFFCMFGDLELQLHHSNCNLINAVCYSDPVTHLNEHFKLLP